MIENQDMFAAHRPIREMMEMNYSADERGAMTGSDSSMPGLTAPGRLGRVNEEGKKQPVPSQHRSSVTRNYSEVSEEQEVRKEEGVLKLFPSSYQEGNLDSSDPMDTASAEEEEEAGLDVNFGQAHDDDDDDEVCQSGKRLPRYDNDNLEMSPDFGRREGSHSRHICKVCAKEFPSGRALGGHMRAHGSGDAAAGPLNTTADGKQLNRTSGQLVLSNAAVENGSEHAMIVKKENTPSPYSKRSRHKDLQNGRVASGRRTTGKRREKSTSKCSLEDAAATTSCRQHMVDDEELQENTGSNRATKLEPLMSSSSSGGNSEDGVTHDDGTATDDAVENVCDICNKEFDNGKQLNAHKKSHEVYALRSNPKRSRRFIDQDYTEVAPSTLITKKTYPNFEKVDGIEKCSECNKRFHSLKALFGHMRCHPDRTWRGIHPPSEGKDDQGASTSAAGERNQQQTGHRKKKPRPSPTTVNNNNRAEANSSESDPSHPVAMKQSGSRRSPSEEIESDTESIEAAYRRQSESRRSSSPGWFSTGKTGKRSKRASRQKLLQRMNFAPNALVIANAQSSNTGGGSGAGAEDLDPERDLALVMMMLGNGKTDQECQEGGAVPEVPVHVGSVGNDLSSGTERDDLVEGAGAGVTTELQGDRPADMSAADSEAEKPNVVDEGCLSSDSKEVSGGGGRSPTSPRRGGKSPPRSPRSPRSGKGAGNGKGAGESGESSKGEKKYKCSTCERKFRSHQALGGHRASHKKVKGCHARSNVDENMQDLLSETSEEFLRSEEQLPTELQGDLSQSEGDDKERQMTSVSKEDSTEIALGVGGSIKKGAHKCTECHRCFNSGQALGGHKRCHFDPSKKDREKEVTSSNVGGKQRSGGRGASSSQGRARTQSELSGIDGRNHQIVRAKSDPSANSTAGERAQPAAQVRAVKEIDLNLPPPVNAEDEFFGQVQNHFEYVEQKRGGEQNNHSYGEGQREYNFTLLSYETRVDDNSADLNLQATMGFRPTDLSRYVTCDQCTCQFVSVEALEDHIRSYHSSMAHRPI